MTSYLNVKNKKGLSKLAILIKQAGFDDVKVTVGSKSIIVTPSQETTLKAGLADLKSGHYKSFKSVSDGIKFLKARTKKTGESLSRKR